MTTSTWGVDLSTSGKRTSAVRVQWDHGRAEVIEVNWPLDPGDLATLIRRHHDDAWGIDVPFGWPRGWAEFVTGHSQGPTAVDQGPSSPWRLRATDRQLQTGAAGFSVNPLSVTHDRLGSVAVVWAFVEHQLATGHPRVVVDRSGMTGACFETYPSGIRASWALPRRGADGERQMLAEHLTSIGIDVSLITKTVPDHHAEHTWDALLCALAARARQLGDLPQLTAQQYQAARVEGWIHLPQRPLTALVTG
jgi:hypothetical protein